MTEPITITFTPQDREGWDTYDGKPTSQAAQQVVRNLHIIPTSTGGVQFELHIGGADIELEFDADGRFSGAIIERNREGERL